MEELTALGSTCKRPSHHWSAATLVAARRGRIEKLKKLNKALINAMDDYSPSWRATVRGDSRLLLGPIPGDAFKRLMPDEPSERVLRMAGAVAPRAPVEPPGPPPAVMLPASTPRPPIEPPPDAVVQKPPPGAQRGEPPPEAEVQPPPGAVMEPSPPPPPPVEPPPGAVVEPSAGSGQSASSAARRVSVSEHAEFVEV